MDSLNPNSKLILKLGTAELINMRAQMLLGKLLNSVYGNVGLEALPSLTRQAQQLRLQLQKWQEQMRFC
jgi:hypothetical protein